MSIERRKRSCERAREEFKQPDISGMSISELGEYRENLYQLYNDTKYCLEDCDRVAKNERHISEALSEADAILNQKALPSDVWSHVLGFSDYKTAENLAHTSKGMRRFASPSRLAPQRIRISYDMIPYYRRHNLGESKHEVNTHFAAYDAVDRDDVDAFKFIICETDAEVDLDPESDVGRDLIYDAIESNSLNIIKYLFEEHGYAVREGYLENATNGGRTDILKYLVEQGGDITDEYYVETATYHGYADMLDYLLDHGGVVTDNVLGVAGEQGRPDILLIMIEHGLDAGWALTAASGYGHIDAVRYLVEHGVDINGCDPNGASALLLAVEYGNFNMFRCLVDNGAVLDDEVIQLAIQTGSIPMVAYLRQHGVDINGRNALLIAVKNYDFDMFRYLVDTGVVLDVDVIREAIETGNVSMVMYLKQRGVRINSLYSK